MQHRKKLIEVALPLEAINAESAREKSIHHGHLSTLHLWWACRPLAAARMVIWVALVDKIKSILIKDIIHNSILNLIWLFLELLDFTVATMNYRTVNLINGKKKYWK